MSGHAPTLRPPGAAGQWEGHRELRCRPEGRTKRVERPAGKGHVARVKDRQAILGSRWLKPFARFFGHPSLWHLNRRSGPKALAVGLFAAFIVPAGQFLLSALLAVPLRANVPLAAAATLFSNPLTFAPIYYAAYRVGLRLLGDVHHGPTSDAAAPLIARILDVSAPTALGLLIFAAVGAMLGYMLGSAWWNLRLARRWRRRREAVSRSHRLNA